MLLFPLAWETLRMEGECIEGEWKAGGPLTSDTLRTASCVEIRRLFVGPAVDDLRTVLAVGHPPTRENAALFNMLLLFSVTLTQSLSRIFFISSIRKLKQ